MSNVEHNERNEKEKTALDIMEQQSRHGPSWRWQTAGELQDRWPGRSAERFGKDFANVQH